MCVRRAAAQCLLELQKEALFLSTSELENMSSVCLRAFEGSCSSVRGAVSELLGSVLASALQPHTRTASHQDRYFKHVCVRSCYRRICAGVCAPASHQDRYFKHVCVCENCYRRICAGVCAPASHQDRELLQEDLCWRLRSSLTPDRYFKHVCVRESCYRRICAGVCAPASHQDRYFKHVCVRELLQEDLCWRLRSSLTPGQVL
ncbi:hypothetical protein WMY93_034220 [Mugilogobius chulae]|uniref:Uncharacterized protein n=1 Tax=Mugilogobius chulae TaxID=88201 RepID=A0AAW0MIJ7_9GOBI